MMLAEQGDRQNMATNECPGMVAPAIATALQAPTIAPSRRWLYPYAGTVFPRGLTAPVVQWDLPTAMNAAQADAVRIHMKSMLYEYEGCFPVSNKSSAPIPQAAWDEAGKQSLGQADPLVVEVTVSEAGQVFRLAPLQLIFALANLKSAIYYNTYGSTLATAKGIVGGVIMRVQPGKETPDIYLQATQGGYCIGCHSVSADGSRMVAETHTGIGLVEGPSVSFDLTTAGAGLQPPPLQANLKRGGFAALYPDGSVYLTTGRTGGGPIAPPLGVVGNVPGTFGPETSKLYDMATGVEIPNSGIVDYAYMPNFAINGSAVVFNQIDASGAATGHSLATMSYDRTSHTFSALKPLFQDPAQYPAWPFFLPEVVSKTAELQVSSGERVIFALGASDFVTQEQPQGITPHVSDLWWADVETGKAAPLGYANGQDTTGATYLPYGDRDAHKNYIPTASPVAAGGYFWVFFTSKRNYGNLFVADPVEARADAKKIWVTAIDINATPGTDPSHPAFLLPGQELESGNIRAFAALEPCKENATACDSGVDCCCGFCTEGVCACKTTCAKLDEKCVTADDCCDKTLSCIGGYCGVNPG
jgi:hypothetical protein